MRMSIVQVRTKFKNRIHATLAKYAIDIDEVSDIFGKRGRILIKEKIEELPPETRRSVEEQLELLDQVVEQIDRIEEHVRQVVKVSPEMTLLKSLPGVGDILAIVIALEIGSVERFHDGSHLASYAGLVPRVNSSGGKTHYGKTREDVNHYLKWAFIEAANCVAITQRQKEGSHVVNLLRRVQKQKGYPKAAGAVARHLAEATWSMLKHNAPYRDPRLSKTVSSCQG